MKILGVIDSFGIGGAETQLAQTLNYLSTERGHSCLACSIERPRTCEVQFLPDVNRIYLNKTSPLSAVGALARLTSAVRKFSPDVVYSRLPLANGLARLATWFVRGIPHVAGIDSVPEGFSSAFGGSVGNRLYRKLELFANRIICNSHATVSSAVQSGAQPNKVVLLPNGIDVDRFSPPTHRQPNEQVTLICVAAFRPEKGIPRLLEIMSQLVALEPVRLMIVGDGVERPSVERMIAEYGLDARVDLLGMRSDIADLLKQADIFVSTAYVEGFGIAVAEAAATELPVVAFDAKGGLRDLVLDKKTGIVVPLDRNDMFLEAVARLSREPSTRRRLGTAGRAHILEHCSMRSVMAQLERTLGRWT